MNAALDRIEELAKAATPGPWLMRGESSDDGGVWQQYGSEVGLSGRYIAGSVRMMPDAEKQALDNLRYIAACDPATILDIVAIVRAADAYFAAEKKYRWSDAAIEELERLRVAYDDARASLERTPRAEGG